MDDLAKRILAAVTRKDYKPLKPKALARKLGVPHTQYAEFRRVLRELLRQGRLERARNEGVRAIPPHGTVTGVFRKTSGGTGFVRPHAVDGAAGPEALVRPEDALDAATGDEVLVKITRKPSRNLNPVGKVLEVLTRAVALDGVSLWATQVVVNPC